MSVQSTGRARFWLLVPGLLFMGVFFIAPTLLLFEISFRAADDFGNMLDSWTVDYYAQAFSRPYFSGALIQSLQLSIEVTLTCSVLGFIAAYAIVRARSRVLRSILYAIVISPLLTSVIARSFGWIVLLSRGGLVNKALLAAGLVDQPLRLLYTSSATVVAVAQVLMPFAVLPVVSAFSGTNRDIERASSILGASALRTFFRITLPLAMRGVVVGGLLVFAHAMGIYITPLLVGGASRSLMSIRIYQQTLNYFHVSQAAALSFVLLAVTLGIVTFVSISFNSWSRRRLG